MNRDLKMFTKLSISCNHSEIYRFPDYEPFLFLDDKGLSLHIQLGLSDRIGLYNDREFYFLGVSLNEL